MVEIAPVDDDAGRDPVADDAQSSEFLAAKVLLQHAEQFEARTKEAASNLIDFEGIIADLQAVFHHPSIVELARREEEEYQRSKNLADQGRLVSSWRSRPSSTASAGVRKGLRRPGSDLLWPSEETRPEVSDDAQDSATMDLTRESSRIAREEVPQLRYCPDASQNPGALDEGGAQQHLAGASEFLLLGDPRALGEDSPRPGSSEQAEAFSMHIFGTSSPTGTDGAEDTGKRPPSLEVVPQGQPQALELQEVASASAAEESRERENSPTPYTSAAVLTGEANFAAAELPCARSSSRARASGMGKEEQSGAAERQAVELHQHLPSDDRAQDGVLSGANEALHHGAEVPRNPPMGENREAGKKVYESIPASDGRGQEAVEGRLAPYPVVDTGEKSNMETGAESSARAAAGVKTGAEVGAVLPEEVDEYLANRADFEAQLKMAGGTAALGGREGARRANGSFAVPAGLQNQGGTCYLNSLLQALFWTHEFRDFVYRFVYDPALHVPEETCILQQLQVLFTRLELSECAAASTEALTGAFGWARSDTFAQHDASELMRVLFEALARAAPGAEGFGPIAALYQGELTSFVSCEERGLRSVRAEAFQDLQVQVRGHGTLEAALQAFVTPEVLDGENQWEVDGGARVDALKGLALRREALPRLLTLHLRRFDFDHERARRVKIDDVQTAPLVLDMAPFLAPYGTPWLPPAGGGSPMLFDLVSVLVHAGTAEGGHYFAFARDVDSDGAGSWWEFNDAVVSSASEPRVCSVLGQRPAGESTGGGSAYMLIYRRRGTGTHTSIACEALRPPPPMAAKIAAEDARSAWLRRMVRVRGGVTRVRGFTEGGAECAVEVSCATTLSKLAELLRDALAANPARPAGDPGTALLRACDPVCMRLRRCSVDAGLLVGGATFGGREQESLSRLGLHPSCQLLLEVRREGEAEFEEVGETDLQLRVARWLPGQDGADDPCADGLDGMVSRCGLAERVVLRQGASATESGGTERGFTVAALRKAVKTRLGMENSCVRLIWTGERAGGFREEPRLLELEGDDALLVSLGVRGGDAIVAEQLSAAEGGADEPQVDRSPALRALARAFFAAALAYSLPAAASGPPPEGGLVQSCGEQGADGVLVEGEPERVVHVDLRVSLAELKRLIAERHGLDPERYHLRRSPKAPQFKDEAASLRSLGFVHGSSVTLARGAPLRPGFAPPPSPILVCFVELNSGASVREVELKVSLLVPPGLDAPPGTAPSLRPLVSFTANKSATVAQVKMALGERLAGSKRFPEVCAWAAAAHAGRAETRLGARLRLRDRRGRGASEVGKLLRDGVALERAIPRIADGKEVSVELLSEDEEIGPASEHMIVEVRWWAPGAKRLSAGQEVVVPKGASLRTLREMLAQKMGLVGDQGVDDGAPSDGTHDAPSSARSRQEGEYGGESDSSSADDEEKAGCNKIENKPPVAILVEGTKSVDQQEHEGPLRLARATPGGPPLDPGRAAQLEWIGAARDNMECPVSGPPLSLRDGAVVVARSAEDEERVSEAVENEVAIGPAAASGFKGMLQPNPPAGQGSSRARGGTRSRVVGRTEVGIKITVAAAPSAQTLETPAQRGTAEASAENSASPATTATSGGGADLLHLKQQTIAADTSAE